MAKKTASKTSAYALHDLYDEIWQATGVTLPPNIDRLLFMMLLRHLASDFGLESVSNVGFSDKNMEHECRVTGLIAVDGGVVVSNLVHLSEDLRGTWDDPIHSEWVEFILPPSMQQTHVLEDVIAKLEAAVVAVQALGPGAYVEFGSWFCLSASS